MKCQICHEKGQYAEWAWQPFGPNETPDSFMLLGSHYRGFLVIKVCGTCRSAIQTGDFEVRFTYQGHHFLAKGHKVIEVQKTLWNGGTTTLWPGTTSESATMIMQDTIADAKLVALVLDLDLITPFVVAPRLREACQELQKLNEKITKHLNNRHVPEEDCDEILLALAKVFVEMEPL